MTNYLIEPFPPPGHGALTPWLARRDEWVRRLSAEDLLRVIERVQADSGLDENGGDRAERSETVEWLASRGERGREWGQAGAAGEDLGLWSDDWRPTGCYRLPGGAMVHVKPGCRCKHARRHLLAG